MNRFRYVFLTSLLIIVSLQGSLLFGAEENAANKKVEFSEEKLQYDFANGLFARELYKEAITEYKTFIGKYPQSKNIAEATFHLGEAYFAIGQYKDAEIIFDTFLKKFPSHKLKTNALLKYSCSQFERRKFKDTIDSLEKLLKLKPDKAIKFSADYYLGRAYNETGNNKKAEEALLKVIEDKNRFYSLALYELSEIYATNNNFANAEKHLRMFLNDNPEKGFEKSALIRLAEALRGQEKFMEASAIYRKLADSSTKFNKAQALLGLGWIKIKENKLDEALTISNEALKLNVKSLENALRYMSGVALYKAKKHVESNEVLLKITSGKYAASAAREIVWNMLGLADLDKALSYGKAYLKAFPKHEPGTGEFLIATTLFRKADYEGAAEFFLKAREYKENPYIEEAAFQLALSYERLGNNKKAAEAYSYFINEFPKSKLYNNALLGWGDILIKLKDFSLAITVFEKISEKRNALPSQQEQALVQQAVCYYELKKYDKMDSCYRTILKSFPQSEAAADALYWIAWGEQHNKNYPAAAERYQEFIKKFPKHEFNSKAIYRMGMAQYQAGNEAKSASIFYDIVLNHPEIKIGQSELLWLGSYFMQNTKLKEAGDIYQTLLKRHPGGEIKAITLYYLAEIQRKSKEYDKAIDTYKRLSAEKGKRFQSLANFGMGLCLRRTGKLKEAKKAFSKVFFSPEDPLMATLHLELGMIEKDTGSPEEAIKHFMRVGLLYDEKDICGEALWEAGNLFEKQGQKQKAVTCYQELTSKKKGSYGSKYAKDSKWSKLAKQRLAEIYAP